MTIWLDVTTTRGWNRPALGIVRVEAETARQFLARRDPGIRFCRFDLDYGSYFEVGPEELGFALERIDAGGVHPASIKAASAMRAEPPVAAPAPWQPGWKRVALTVLARLPDAAQGPLVRFARSRREAARSARLAWRHARDTAALAWRGSDPAPELATDVASVAKPELVRPDILFRHGDVYVSLGLDWDQKDLRYLGELKRQLQLKVLLMCYDIIPIRLPHLCVAEVAAKFTHYFVDVARCADVIICISAYSRNDLRRFLEASQEPVPQLDLVRLGDEIVRADTAPPGPQVRELIGQRFVLFVSTIERRKNHETLYRAYARLVDEGVTDLPVLVFVGMAGWGTSDLMADLAGDPRTRARVRVLNHLSDGDLAHLYEHCYFTVYPSLYEGWGLPVAESLAYGKFCLASNAASIPEVGGDLVEYIDPWDVPRWAARIAWYVAHPEIVAERNVAIRTRYRPTTWHETGRTIVAAAEALQDAPASLTLQTK